MSYRVQCSACNKVMVLDDDAAGQRLVCIACGARLQAPPPVVVQAVAAPDPTDEALAAAAAIKPAPRAKPERDTGRRNTILTAAAVSFAVVAVAVFAVLMMLNRRDGMRQPGDRRVTSAEMRANSDLLALKSEAEAFAIEGKLAESHEKYRKLQSLAVGRDIKDPLLWDIMERAKLDQDNVYMLLLRQQIPPGENPGAAFTVPPYAQNGTPGNPPLPETAPVEGQGTTADAVATGEPGAPGADPNAPEGAPATQEVAASQPGAPTLVAQVPPSDSITDEQIGEAMKKGVDFLIAHVKNGQVGDLPELTGVKQQGMNALVVYALLTSGQAMNDERLNVRGDFMKGLVEKMKSHELKARRGDPQQPITYARSLRAAALAVYNRPEDRKVLKGDVDWLVAAAVAGAYTYDDQLSRSPTARTKDEPPAQKASADEMIIQAQVLAAGWEFANYSSDGDDVPQPAGLWYDDGSAAVIPIHGIHDANGRELYVPVTNGPRLTPMPQVYPPRLPTVGPGVGGPRTTTPPGLGRPSNTRLPPGAYNRTLRDMPGEMPQRDAGGDNSLSSPFQWDASNSQYGLLGVWAGAEVGVEVPVRYWKEVEKHWTETQLNSGEWGYNARDRSGYLAMTCGGVASLFVTHDWLAAPALKDTGREPLTPALASGLAWLERGDNCVNVPNSKTHYVGYDLFGLERVALASGFKYFGKHDWFRELAANALGTQWPTGAWGREPDGPDAIVDTAYTLLFLARGRNPILMNKLRFDRGEGVRLDGKAAPGYWANRPRDLANLTRYTSRQLERGLNWQVVSLESPWHDWLDAPILYIASHQPPALQDADYENLRQYVEAGGILFTHADTGAPTFNRWVAKLAEKIAPGRSLDSLPDDHPVYGVNYKIKAPKPKLQAVTNGSRLLLVHSPNDLSMQWQQRGERMAPENFRLGVNLFLYAAGKSGFRNRLSSPYIRQPKSEPQGSVPVARVKYEGNWDPEPGAWGRFGRAFQWQTDFATAVRPVELAALKAGEVQVAHLTGNAAQKFSADDVAAVKTFVEGGGVLLVDAAGGSQPFYESVENELLAKAFPGVDSEPVPADHPLLKPAGEKEPLAPKLRPFAGEVFKDAAPKLSLMSAGKGVVVLSPFDLTSGLLGTNTWGIAGYEPASAQAIVRNTLLWAHSRPEARK